LGGSLSGFHLSTHPIEMALLPIWLGLRDEEDVRVQVTQTLEQEAKYVPLEVTLRLSDH
jgi:hypothetical protein